MKEILEEYGAAVLALAGAVAILALAGNYLLTGDGLLGQFLSIWGNGGC